MENWERGIYKYLKRCVAAMAWRWKNKVLVNEEEAERILLIPLTNSKQTDEVLITEDTNELGYNSTTQTEDRSNYSTNLWNLKVPSKIRINL
ncbi:hypothetical protein EPI10_015039 [Gossypium australe]|uniref:Uncharacterized protein n=1 Tax=Gossypium australe TaxID=47621 RepID=A0A5B6VJH8_9ROSI|nr:hypothetical protein EPI10_015039 [Gossypium australe]